MSSSELSRGSSLPERAGNGADFGPPVPSANRSLEIEVLEENLRSVQRREKRHLLWMVLGISPAAVLPALGLLREGNIGLLLLLGVLVTGSEWFAWIRASHEAERLERKLRELREER